MIRGMEVSQAMKVEGIMRAWSAYAVVGLMASAAIAGIASLALDFEATRAVWISAALAYVLQLAAFAALLKFRSNSQLFMAGWLVGMALRFAVVGLFAWWLANSQTLPRQAALVSLVGFVFVLLVLEPVFLRWDARK